jgi:hypothetical protein
MGRPMGRYTTGKGASAIRSRYKQDIVPAANRSSRNFLKNSHLPLLIQNIVNTNTFGWSLKPLSLQFEKLLQLSHHLSLTKKPTIGHSQN